MKIIASKLYAQQDINEDDPVTPSMFIPKYSRKGTALRVKILLSRVKVFLLNFFNSLPDTHYVVAIDIYKSSTGIRSQCSPYEILIISNKACI